MKNCLGCDQSISDEQWEDHQGVCDECEYALDHNPKTVKNFQPWNYSGRGLKLDPFVY